MQKILFAPAFYLSNKRSYDSNINVKINNGVWVVFQVNRYNSDNYRIMVKHPTEPKYIFQPFTKRQFFNNTQMAFEYINDVLVNEIVSCNFYNNSKFIFKQTTNVYVRKSCEYGSCEIEYTENGIPQKVK